MKIERLETFSTKMDSIVRVTTNTGEQGIGQISPWNADISATVFHRQVAPHALGRDPLEIEKLVDDIVMAEYKFPWSYLCRAVTGLDTALWDLKAKREGVSVCELFGSKPGTLKPYGSSMRRDIEPENEAQRLAQLHDEKGYGAFKIRVGGWSSKGNDEDEWPGRTEELVPTVRDAIGDDVELFVDGNSAYTPEKAIEVGEEILAPNNVVHFEEPCPYWELEWTAEVTEALEDVPVAGGEQDNDLAQWRRMIDMDAVDIVQPDVCYLGGISRTLEVAEMAADAGLLCVPHSANHSMVTVFTMHLLEVIDNSGEFFEFSIEDHWAQDGLFTPTLTVEDGEIATPDGEGWGVDIFPERLAQSEYEVSEV